MDCNRAKELIDLRVQAAAEPGAAEHDWSELDAHLAKCPKCSADLLELMRTRDLLASVTGDGPTDEETTKMWQAIEQSLPAGALMMQVPSVSRRVGRFVAACAGIAAVLTIALMIGRERYEGEQADAGLVAASNLRGLGTASGIYGSAEEGPLYVADTTWLGDRADSPPAHRDRARAPSRSRASRRMGASLRESVPDSEDMKKIEALGYVAAPVRSPGPSEAEADTYHPLVGPADWQATAAAGGLSLGYDDSYKEPPPATPPPMLPALPEPGTPKVPAPDEPDVPAAATDRRPAGGTLDREEPPPPRTPPAVQPKIIKTGELVIEVPVYDQAAAQVERIVGQHGGFVADVAVREREGGALQGSLVVRVPPERFEALFAALKAVGRVESENVKAADVTAQYVDLEARICGLQITEERLQELIQSKSFIDKIESLLEVEREMTRVRSEIEQLQGQLRVMANRVAMSTITITLSEPSRTVPSASMSVEVPTVADAADTLGETLAKLGGRLLSGKTSKRTDGTLQADYKLQVSLARFGEMVAAIEALGRVEQRQVANRQFDDATRPWADKVDCQLALVLYERSQQPPRGAINIEVDDLAAARKRLEELLAPCEAAVMSSKTSRRDDGSSAGELRVRVSAGRFAELVDSLGSLGRTLAKETAGATGKIVGGAANVASDFNLTLAEPARQVPRGSMAIEVQTFETARGKLSNLVAEKHVQVLRSSSKQRPDGTWSGGFRLGIKAGDMDSVVARLESFGRVTSREITGIGLGDLSRSDPNALGIIELTLAEKRAINPEPDRAGNSIRSRLRDGLAGFYDSLGLIAYGLMAMAPWVIIVLLAAWVSLRLYRRRRPVPNTVTRTQPPADG